MGNDNRQFDTLVALGYYTFGFFASMKLTEFPEREERMKNYRRQRRNLYIYLVFSLAITAVAAASTGKLTIIETGLILALVICLVAVPLIWNVHDALLQIPNGLPRPEDELSRKEVFLVSGRIGGILHLAPNTGDALIFWSFENLPAEVESGKRIVYLDNLESEYLAAWKEAGVIPILSAQGRAKMDTKKGEHAEARNRFSQAMS